MKKTPSSLAALVVVVLSLVAGCGGSSSKNAATVDGATIASKDVFDVLDSAWKDTTVRSEIAPDGYGTDKDKPPTSYKPDVTATVLSNLIVFRVIDDELNRRGITPTATEGDDAFARWQSKRDKLDGDVAKLGDVYKNQQWSDADVQAYYDALGARFEQACTHHILVDTKEAADAIVAGIKSGKSFSDFVAQSTDEGSKAQGGDVGCNPREGALVQEYTDAVAKAKTGDVIGPVKTSFGYHVIQVDKAFERKPLDDALKQTIRDELTDTTTHLQYLVRVAKVTVDKRFGRWDAAQYSVQAPTTTTTAPKKTTTTTTGAPATSAASPSSTGATTTTATTTTATTTTAGK